MIRLRFSICPAIALLITVSCGGGYQTVKTRLNQPNHTESNQTENHVFDQALQSYRHGDYAEALHLFEQATTNHPSDWRGHYYLGMTCSRLGQHQRALKGLNEGLDLAPADRQSRSRIYVGLATNFEKMGNSAKAWLNYRTALNLFPGSSDAQLGLQRLAAIGTATE